MTSRCVCSMVHSHLDYDNATLLNLPKSTLKPLQCTQIMQERIYVNKNKYDSSTDCLSTIHWLPVHYRCIYKFMTMVYKTLDENEPQYLGDKLHIKTVDRMTRYNKSNTK